MTELSQRSCNFSYLERIQIPLYLSSFLWIVSEISGIENLPRSA